MKFTFFIFLLSATQASLIPRFSQPGDEANWYSCPEVNAVTCSTTHSNNTCCYENIGSVAIQVQSWDYNPVAGVQENFTLKGIMPASCNGTLLQFCNDSVVVNENDIQDIIVNQYGNPNFYNLMESIWISPQGSDQSLWAQEFNKHGSCFSSHRPDCYGENYIPNEHIYDYFRINIAMYQKYPTYQTLKNADIVPSTSKTYTLEEIVGALSSLNGGHSLYLGCDENNALVEVRYYNHFLGPLIFQEYQPIDSFAQSTCSPSGIKFLPKN